MIITNLNKTKDFFEDAKSDIIISEPRKTLLRNIAKKIAIYHDSDGSVNINFICTHNSRRSQLGQVWTYFASDYFNLNINSFSGGTEVTAFHRNTLKTLKDVGFIFTFEKFCHVNPVYNISFNGSKRSIKGFSKLFNDSINQSPYLVLTTCNNADENCPFIPEAIHRFHLPYKDPKYSDNLSNHEAIYLQTNKEIAAEMYFIFNEVNKQLV